VIKSDNVNLQIYYPSVQILDKYHSRENILSELIPSSFNEGNSIKGIFRYYSCIFENRYCHRNKESYYFEQLNDDLIFIKIDLNYKDNAYQYALNGEYIVLQKMAE